MTEEVLVAAIALSPCWSKSWSLSGGSYGCESLPVRAVSESRNGEGNLIELQTIKVRIAREQPT